MIKEILSFGCSFTYGDGVDHLESWPYRLGKKLGVPAYNYGRSGASNKLITSEILRVVDPEKHQDCLVVVAWTHHIRTAFWDERERCWESILVGSASYKDRFVKSAEYYYGNIYSEYDAFFTSFAHKLTVEAYLKKNNIKYVFLNALHEEYEYLDIVDTTLHRLRENIDKTNYMDFYGSIYQLMCMDRPQYICDTDKYHPSIAGHELIANNLLEFITKNGILKQ